MDLRKLKEIDDFKILDFMSWHNINKSESDMRPINIAVLRSYTCELIEPILSTYFHSIGYKAQFYFCDFNQYAQDILSEKSGFNIFNPDVVLFFTLFEDVLPSFYSEYSSNSVDVWRKRSENAVENIANLLSIITDRHKCPVIMQLYSYTDQSFFGLADDQALISQMDIVNQANLLLKLILNDSKLVFYWDYNKFLLLEGFKTIYNPRAYYYAGDPFLADAYCKIGSSIMKIVNAYFGNKKKCIVLDLDNTLWGGVVGEDGIEGIKIGGDYPGNCFTRVQEKLLSLKDSGLILAINSKNNLSDIIPVFETHPEMKIKLDDIVVVKANWQDKVSNLRNIADEVNIGLDSLLFIDDNPAEIALVNQELPEVETLLFDGEPALLPSKIDDLKLVSSLKLTREDLKKTSMYQGQRQRNEEKSSALNLSSFLQDLKMELYFEVMQNVDIERVAQLTQKTNQFNLSTCRYSIADILQMNREANTCIITVRAGDKFGDYGVVGCIILKVFDKACLVDTFLLSCRVLSRGIEAEMLKLVVRYADKHKASIIKFNYNETLKNEPLKHFLQSKNISIENKDNMSVPTDSLSLEKDVSYVNVSSWLSEPENVV